MPNNFRTEVVVPKYPFKIGYNTPTLLCGSCFTENIGNIMFQKKFPVLINPFGVVYNPISVKLVLDKILNTTSFGYDDLDFRNGLWFSHLHHTSFSSPNKKKCLDSINNELEKSVAFFKKIKYLLITFGTARTYYLKKTNDPVANCHKIPSKEFNNKLLTVDEIFIEWSVLLNKIFSLNKDIKVIFTVSPVRHWKDGPQGNQLSKSILHMAINEIIETDKERLFYFPAYEIMMDDLRDYRFYAEDMLHIAPRAIDYIWEKFKEATIDSESINLMKQVDKILTAVGHRPFNPQSKEHQHFLREILKDIKHIKKGNPKIDFSTEEQIISGFLV